MQDLESKENEFDKTLIDSSEEVSHEEVRNEDHSEVQAPTGDADTSANAFENLFEDEVGSVDDENVENEEETGGEEGYKVLGEAAFVLHKTALPFVFDKLLGLVGKKINYQIFDLITKEEKKTLVKSYNILIKHYLKTAPSTVSAAWGSVAAVVASQILLSIEDDNAVKKEEDLFETGNENNNRYKETFIKTKKRGRPRKNK